MSIEIALAVAILLGILAISYMQTIGAYPTGGGSYVVARENLGQGIGLIAAAALMIDYVLTAAVSLTAGVAAIASAFPDLWQYRIGLSLLLLTIITLANLLHNQTAWMLKLAILYGRRRQGQPRVIIDVPMYLRK